MSLSLTLYLVDQGSQALSRGCPLMLHDRLSMTDYDLLGQIVDMSYRPNATVRKRIKTYPIPSTLWVEHPQNAERVREDNLGADLTFSYAKDLARLEIGKDTSPFERAIVAYIRELPSDTPIILWWG